MDDYTEKGVERVAKCSQIKVLSWRLDRRRGGVGASNTLCYIHYNRI